MTKKYLIAIFKLMILKCIDKIVKNFSILETRIVQDKKGNRAIS